MKRYFSLILVLFLFIGCDTDKSTSPDFDTLNKGDYRAYKADAEPEINGVGSEAAWSQVEWAPIDVLWLGEEPSATDFSGRFKVIWTEEQLYFLFEITDNAIVDVHQDPLDRYWEDDCLEIFLDADNSGGNHQYNHNAFAYHIAYDGHAVDIGVDEKAHLYDEHVTSNYVIDGNNVTWEVGVLVYGDEYVRDPQPDPLILDDSMELGLMVAYCDADGDEGRESFIGSIEIKGSDKNLGWQTADVFGTLYLDDK